MPNLNDGTSQWTNLADTDHYTDASVSSVLKCFCCKEGIWNSGDGGFFFNIIRGQEVVICSKCQQEYLTKHLEDFKKFTAMRKIQLGK